jgi:hypothetical protein
VIDATLHGNVVANHGSQGRFAWIWSGSRELELTSNTFAGPNLEWGAYHTVAVLVQAADLSSFSVIDANTWPETPSGGWTQGANIFVGSNYDQPGFRDAQAWDALNGSGNDGFAAVDSATMFADWIDRFGSIETSQSTQALAA